MGNACPLLSAWTRNPNPEPQVDHQVLHTMGAQTTDSDVWSAAALPSGPEPRPAAPPPRRPASPPEHRRCEWSARARCRGVRARSGTSFMLRGSAAPAAPSSVS